MMSDLESSHSEPFSCGSSDVYVPPEGESFSSSGNENNMPGPSTSGHPRKHRKSSSPSRWKCNIIEKSIAERKAYVNTRGEEKAERKTGPDCRCKK